MLRPDILNYGSTHALNDTAPSQTKFSMDFLANQLVQYLLHALSNAPQICKLNFIIPSGWCGETDTITDGRPHIYESGQIDSDLHQPDTWKALDAFFRLQLPIEVSITSLSSQWEEGEDSKVHKHLMNRVRRHFGIWDQREAWEYYNYCAEVRITSATEHPDEILRDIYQLFSEPIV
jgi:hypothetical protein